jgi:hypothetical protein
VVIVDEISKWALIGEIFASEINKIERVKILINGSEYEMQLCYLEPLLQKFSLRINGEMNPDFDYLSRFEEMERVMKLESNSTIEQALKDENETLKARAELLEQGIEIMRKALNDAQIKREPIIFDGV